MTVSGPVSWIIKGFVFNLFIVSHKRLASYFFNFQIQGWELLECIIPQKKVVYDRE